MTTAEAKITPRVMRWFRKTSPVSAPFEIKHTNGKDLFRIKDLSIHQQQWLQACNSDIGCIWKIPDANIGHNPFDGFFYRNAPAYVIIVFPQEVFAIDINEFLKLNRASIGAKNARFISEFEVLLSDI